MWVEDVVASPIDGTELGRDVASHWNIPREEEEEEEGGEERISIREYSTISMILKYFFTTRGRLTCRSVCWERGLRAPQRAGGREDGLQDQTSRGTH